MKSLLLTLLASMVACYGYSQKTDWKVDRSHSNIRFTVVHMLISEVDGEFNDFSGTVSGANEDFDGAKVEFTANTESVDTNNERRDNHLRSDDFFNAEKYPTLKFDGTIEKKGKKYFLVGNLTIRDVTKEVRFETTYLGSMKNGERGRKAGFKVVGKINRFDYNLKWDRTVEAGGLVVGEDVEITCKIELNEVQEK